MNGALHAGPRYLLITVKRIEREEVREGPAPACAGDDCTEVRRPGTESRRLSAGRSHRISLTWDTERREAVRAGRTDCVRGDSYPPPTAENTDLPLHIGRQRSQ